VTDPNLYAPTLIPPAVSVRPLGDMMKYQISWPAQTAAAGYRVYAGYDPLHIRSLISGQVMIPAGTLTYLAELPSVPPNQMVYFWVGAQDGAGAITFIDEMGSTYLRTVQASQFEEAQMSETTKLMACFGDQKYFTEEMRRRSLAVLEDTAEEMDLYIKQWTGVADATTQKELGLDPNYQGMSRNDDTYGVGFFPGYFPAIGVRVRMGGAPQQQYDYQPYGMRPLGPNEGWTLWEPLLHEGDILVRKNTGIRYVVKVVSPSNYRGVPMSQRLSLDTINPTSPLYKITDTDVRAKWNSLNSMEYLAVGFSVFPPQPADLTDYLILK
jgi:hypothetical protein